MKINKIKYQNRNKKKRKKGDIIGYTKNRAD
jgi:hypothetical protein